MITDEQLTQMAARLVDVPGVVGVLLGGSRARGTHTLQSDVDLGLYYRRPLDVGALSALAREVAGPEADVTAIGAWGPWVDGGGWLTVAGTPVDWIYRDLDRVRASWTAAQEGRYAFHFQVGHPLGVPDFAYAGEAALGVILADPSGQLEALQQELVHYPPLLGQALAQGLWEAHFVVQGARKAAPRRDTAYIAGCLFRAVLLCAHALHGDAGRWLVNEKGAVAAAAALANAPAGFASRAHAVLGELGSTPDQLHAALDAAVSLITDTQRSCSTGSRRKADGV